MSKSMCTVVSLDGSSQNAYKIVMLHTDGSEVTLTELAAITRAGMNYIPSHVLSKMFESSGLKVTEVTKENGNEPLLNNRTNLYKLLRRQNKRLYALQGAGGSPDEPA